MTRVSVRTADAVGIIELNHPPANSYDISLMRELADAITAVDTNGDIAAVILRSAIPGFFCGGADIKAFGKNAPRENVEMIAYAHDTLRSISRSDKIFIAEIGGHCLGGGLEIALACDLRMGADGPYKIGLPEVKLGILPGNGGTQKLPALVGPSKALELMITGRTLSPEEALRHHILDRLYPKEDLADETMRFATDLSQGATLAIAMIKRATVGGPAASLDAGLALERECIARLFYSSDAAEGFSAFVERRAPEFRGE